MGVEDDFFFVGVFEGLGALDVGVICDGTGGGGQRGGRGHDGGCAREAGEVATKYCQDQRALLQSNERMGTHDS